MQSRTSCNGKSSYTITPVLFGFGGMLPGAPQSTCALPQILIVSPCEALCRKPLMLQAMKLHNASLIGFRSVVLQQGS